jgi:hypothetical protein
LQSSSSSTFLALFVGCNKGYDALNALRMGSANPTFDKLTWNTAMTYNSTITLHNDVCNEITNPQFDIILPLENKEKEKEKFVQVHCIEPMPATVKELQRAAVQTGYDNLGFIVTHAAMSADMYHSHVQVRWVLKIRVLVIPIAKAVVVVVVMIVSM